MPRRIFKKSKKPQQILTAVFLCCALALPADFVFFQKRAASQFPYSVHKMICGGAQPARVGDAVIDNCGYGKAKVCRDVLGIKRWSHCRFSDKFIASLDAPEKLPAGATARGGIGRLKDGFIGPFWGFDCNPDTPYYDKDLNVCLADCGDKTAIDNFPGLPNKRCITKR
jgi:hypothetical protein